MKNVSGQGGLFDEPEAPRKVSRGGISSLGNILQKYQPKEKNKYVSREFQDYGYRLAMELGDELHKSLYIRLAKTVERGLLESARSFAIDSQARSRAKLFMWKLKELRATDKNKK